MDEFIIEVKQMSYKDLENCINLFQDAYTKEEYQVLKNEYTSRADGNVINEPVFIYCRKCDSANEFGNNVCKYCNEPLNKYTLKEDDNIKQDEKCIIGYVIALLIPVIGIIMGLIYISRTEDHYGMKLIITSIISSVICTFILSLII